MSFDDALKVLMVEVIGSDGRLTPADVLNGYELSGIDLDSDPIYLGYENADGAWYIKRINFTTKRSQYFAGTTDFETSWTAKAGLAYGNFNSIF
jgi:hypothetical protein